MSYTLESSSSFGEDIRRWAATLAPFENPFREHQDSDGMLATMASGLHGYLFGFVFGTIAFPYLFTCRPLILGSGSFLCDLKKRQQVLQRQQEILVLLRDHVTMIRKLRDVEFGAAAATAGAAAAAVSEERKTATEQAPPRRPQPRTPPTSSEGRTTTAATAKPENANAESGITTELQATSSRREGAAQAEGTAEASRTTAEAPGAAAEALAETKVVAGAVTAAKAGRVAKVGTERIQKRSRLVAAEADGNARAGHQAAEERCQVLTASSLRAWGRRSLRAEQLLKQQQRQKERLDISQPHYVGELELTPAKDGEEEKKELEQQPKQRLYATSVNQLRIEHRQRTEADGGKIQQSMWKWIAAEEEMLQRRALQLQQQDVLLRRMEKAEARSRDTRLLRLIRSATPEAATAEGWKQRPLQSSGQKDVPHSSLITTLGSDLCSRVQSQQQKFEETQKPKEVKQTKRMKIEAAARLFFKQTKHKQQQQQHQENIYSRTQLLLRQLQVMAKRRVFVPLRVGARVGLVAGGYYAVESAFCSSMENYGPTPYTRLMNWFVSALYLCQRHYRNCRCVF